VDRERFEQVAQEVWDGLPENLKKKIENVHIVVEDEPSAETLRKSAVGRGALLLGLYEGIPLSKRGSYYGTYPTLPDKITLYQRSIEAVTHSEARLREKIHDVLIHEIAHYFGMTEREVREAGY
jgi:predicted Zn-dependent protease with MMP-like domain